MPQLIQIVLWEMKQISTFKEHSFGFIAVCHIKSHPVHENVIAMTHIQRFDCLHSQCLIRFLPFCIRLNICNHFVKMFQEMHPEKYQQQRNIFKLWNMHQPREHRCDYCCDISLNLFDFADQSSWFYLVNSETTSVMTEDCGNTPL